MGFRFLSLLARLGTHGFKPDPKKAAGRLDDLRLPAGEALPPNARAELRRDVALLRALRDQIEEIGDARGARLAEAPDETPHARDRMPAGLRGLREKTADMLVGEALSRDLHCPVARRLRVVLDTSVRVRALTTRRAPSDRLCSAKPGLAVTPRELLTGTSFALSLEAAAGGTV